METRHMRNVGIEIEVESTTVDRPTVHRMLESKRIPHWQLDDHEGSLRGGAFGWEIKSAGDSGIPDTEISQALAELYPAMVGSTGVWRSAVHVHVNVRDLTWQQRALALALVYSLEDSIFEVTSPERRESNFCVPLTHKPGMSLAAIRNMANGGAPAQCGKYSALNIDCWSTFGTFEFRHMRTPYCTGEVSSVSAALLEIERFANRSVHIINAAADAPVTDASTVRDAFGMLAHSKYLWSLQGLTISPSAALSVLVALASQNKLDRKTYSALLKGSGPARALSADSVNEDARYNPVRYRAEMGPDGLLNIVASPVDEEWNDGPEEELDWGELDLEEPEEVS